MSGTEAILWLVALAIGMGLVFWFSRDTVPLLSITVSRTETITDDNADRINSLYRRLWSEDDPAERAAIYAEIEVLRS